MNTKIISQKFKILGMIAFGVFANAQSLYLTSALPVNVTVGSSPSFTLNYTSATPCKIIVSLIKSQSDGVTPDWNTWQTGTILDNLPATSSPVSKTITVTVPANQTVSTDLPSGINYLWALTLQDSSGGWIAGSQPQTNIISSNTVIDNVSFNGALPASVSAGSTQSIPYKYTATTDRIVKVGLSKYSSSGNWISDVVSVIINPASATTTTPVSGVANLAIPAGTTSTANLSNGEYYGWEATMATTSWSYMNGTNTNVVVTSANTTLSVSDSEAAKNPIKIYPNPVKNTLYFSNPEKIKSVKINDLTGKEIFRSTRDLDKGVDFSEFAKGTYIITLNGTDSQKIIKE